MTSGVATGLTVGIALLLIVLVALVGTNVLVKNEIRKLQLTSKDADQKDVEQRSNRPESFDDENAPMPATRSPIVGAPDGPIAVQTRWLQSQK